MSFSMTRSESDAYYVLEKEKGLRFFDDANHFPNNTTKDFACT
jgi:hypothetical protein